MSSRRRKLGLAATALAATVVVATLMPQQQGSGPAIAPSANEPTQPTEGQVSTAGRGEVTPEMQAEIDRVVDAGATTARTKANTLVTSQIRCAEFEGQRYCLGQGWTDESEYELQSRMSARLTARTKAVEKTGDLDPLALLQRRATMSPTQRAAAERKELETAAASVAKVWLLRHEIQGVPLPEGFHERHPEVQVLTRGADGPATETTSTTTKSYKDYPDRATVLKYNRVSEQIRTYWCGPATMQMIAWGWQKSPKSQAHWARRLGTTTSGSAITELVRVINSDTGWDNKNRAGTYITLDIGNWTYAQWYKLIMRHVRDYRAPIVMHPVLEKRFYSYLDDDASGHFQAGRGYQKRPNTAKLVGYFEPWNQQRFDPSEPYIRRVQWYSAYKQYRANRNHFQHNIGV